MTKRQLEAGINLDAVQIEETFAELNSNKVHRGLFRFWAQNSGKVLDYYIDRMEAEGVHVDIGMLNSALAETENPLLKQYQTAHNFGAAMFTEEGEWANHRTVRLIEGWAREAGADIRYNTKAVRLVREGDGPVTGVIARTAQGLVQFNGANGIVLATGGIGSNPGMIHQYAPLCEYCLVNAYQPAGNNTGDGIALTLWAGGAVQKAGAAPMFLPLPQLGGPLSNAGDLSWLAVNLNGERYMNEYSSVPGICHASFLQPKGLTYAIYDGSYQEDVLALYPDNKNFLGEPLIAEDMDATFANAAEMGTLFKADTLEELAEQLGADPEALVATVARYNELVDAGYDSDYAKPSKWLSRIDEPPFYASFNSATYMTVLFGVNCDVHARVCDHDDKPLGNLYAIGNAMGNMFADTYPMLCPAISHGRCFTFGRMLGQALARGEMI